MYRCGICQKPFVSFKSIPVSDTFGEYFMSVTPCCNSHSYSHISDYFLSIISGGSAETRIPLSANEATELGSNWAIDFCKEQQ